jgi:hypothetical protein
MSHYDITEWADFVRGLGGVAERRRMEQHLASGCRTCGERARVMRGCLELAAAEASYELPRYAEQSAKVMFLARRPEKIRLLPRLAARLVLSDAVAEPVGGVRSLERFSHQALYEAGQFAVDLRLDQEYGATTVVLVGQITDRSAPARKLPNVPVLLVSDGEILNQTSSNQFGEFHLEYQPKGRLTLCAAVGNGKCIEVPLHGLASDRPSRRALSIGKPFGNRRRR